MSCAVLAQRTSEGNTYRASKVQAPLMQASPNSVLPGRCIGQIAWRCQT
jgi:hypothetical protein